MTFDEHERRHGGTVLLHQGESTLRAGRDEAHIERDVLRDGADRFVRRLAEMTGFSLDNRDPNWPRRTRLLHG